MTKDMTKGSPFRLMLAFAVPIMIGNIFMQLYHIVDTAIVGRVLGASSLGAVGSTGSLNWMINGFMMGMCHGFSIKISQSFGSKNQAETRHSVMMSLYLSGGISIVVSVLGSVFAGSLLRLMKTPEDIIGEATVYISIIFGSCFLGIIYNMASAILRALGNSRTPLYAVAISALLNLLLDILFVAVFGWGVAGAAVATVLSNLVCGIFCLVSVFRIESLKMEKKDMAWSGASAREMVGMGLPIGLMNSVTAIGNVILQSVVNTMGSAIVAAYTVGSKILNLSDNVLNVMENANGTFVAQNYGAGDIKRVRRGVRTAAFMGLGLSVILSVTLIFFGKPIASIFVSAEEIGVAYDAYPFVFICGVMMWALSMLFVFRASLHGLGNTVIPMFSGIAELAMRMGTVMILPVSLGFARIGMAEVSAWLGAMLMLVISYFVIISKKSRECNER